MQPGLRLTTSQSLQVSAHICSAVEFLRMSNDEVARHLAKASAQNPLLDIRLPSQPSNLALPEVAADTSTQSLYSHVAQQINAAFDDPAQHRIAIVLLEALEPSGWLGRDIPALAAACNEPAERIETVLNRCQQFEPTGLFARDLSECLRLQLLEMGKFNTDTQTVLANLGAFLEGGIDEMQTRTGLNSQVIAAVLADIRGCNPKPGAAFEAIDPTLARSPDVIVRKSSAGWQIELNRSNLPSVSLVDVPGAGDTGMQRLRSDARALVDALRRRNHMILRVARSVIGHQTRFLEQGDKGLLPLRRIDIARRLGVHESTISRAAQGLLVQTPGELLELKRFFSRGLGRTHGQPESRRHLYERLRQIIQSEDRATPKTDQAIALSLAETGARISRRTVAKYRAKLGIPGAPARAQRAAQE